MQVRVLPGALANQAQAAKVGSAWGTPLSVTLYESRTILSGGTQQFPGTPCSITAQLPFRGNGLSSEGVSSGIAAKRFSYSRD